MQTDHREVEFDEPRDGGERRLAAIMFTDIVGYSALVQNNEALALELLNEHRRLLRPIFAIYAGEEIQTVGDSFLIEFRSALEAVRCGIKVQQELSRRNLESTSIRQILVRIGIHVGDIVKVGKDIYGDTVNLAKRIESICEPAGIAISAQAFEYVKNRIPFLIEKLGEYSLKNIATPTLIYKIQLTSSKKPVIVPLLKQRRFAVLPLMNIGKGDEYIAEGLTEELISAFSHVPALKVVSRTTTMRYKGSTKSISEIGNELNVSTILEGSVRNYGTRLRISMKLIETTTEEYLWGEDYDRNIEDILDVQHDVALKTVEALKPKMANDQAVQLGPEKGTNNPEAYLQYLKGRYHLARHSEIEVKSAIDLFERAIQLDPNFALAHAMLAQCRMFLGFFGFMSPSEAFEKAIPALNRALAIDQDIDLAHMLMGRLLQDKWDWIGAEAEFKRATEISPNSAEAHYRYALLLIDLKRGEEALDEVRKAEELDPLSVPVNQIAGTIMNVLGKHHEAVERFQRALEIEPNAAFAQNNLGLAEFEEGNVEKGLAGIRKALEMDPKNVMFRTDLCYALSRSGNESEARDLLLRSEVAANTERVPPVAIAGMNACLGENDNAIIWLEKAYSERSPYLGSLSVERWFDRIRDDPRFAALLKRLRLSD